MLNRDFIKWVFVAFIIATPIAWYAMYRWLQNFVYKTEISLWLFVIAGIVAFGIALVTVNWHSWRASSHPGKAGSLKYP
jgi:putative ABC transport system permease protein